MAAPPPVVQAESSRPANPVARDQIESLLRTLVERHGSDLHLRVNEPPILRVHGELMRIEDKPQIRGDQLLAMVC